MNINKSSAWGMRTPARAYANHTPTSATIHNMGTPTALIKPDWTREDSIAALKSVEWHHVDINGWNATGYHLIVMPDGSVWEGRPLNAIGAHVARKNTDRIGILFYGSFDHEEPTPEQVATLYMLGEWLSKEHNINRIDTHGEVSPTKCPGKHLQSAVENMRARQSIDNGLLREQVKEEIKRLLELL